MQLKWWMWREEVKNINHCYVHFYCLLFLSTPLICLTGLTSPPAQHKRKKRKEKSSLGTQKCTHLPLCTFFFSHSLQSPQKPVQYIFHPHTSNCNSGTPLPHRRCVLNYGCLLLHSRIPRLNSLISFATTQHSVLCELYSQRTEMVGSSSYIFHTFLH